MSLALTNYQKTAEFNEAQITILTKELGANIANSQVTSRVLNKFRQKYSTLIEKHNRLLVKQDILFNINYDK